MPSPQKTAEQTVRILNTNELSGFTPKRQVGIASPCSSCKNHLLDLQDGDVTHTPCPRRSWIRQHNAQTTNSTQDNIYITPYLYESGTDDPNKLSNPVYSEANSTMLVWVALAQNNGDLYDSNGNIVRHSIVGSGFNIDTDSEYLHCEQRPYVPHNTQADLYSKGVIHEQDQLYVDTVYSRELDPVGNQQVLGGTIQKATHPFFFSLKPALRDNIPAGC